MRNINKVLPPNLTDHKSDEYDANITEQSEEVLRTVKSPTDAKIERRRAFLPKKSSPLLAIIRSTEEDIYVKRDALVKRLDELTQQSMEAAEETFPVAIKETMDAWQKRIAYRKQCYREWVLAELADYTVDDILIIRELGNILSAPIKQGLNPQEKIQALIQICSSNAPNVKNTFFTIYPAPFEAYNDTLSVLFNQYQTGELSLQDIKVALMDIEVEIENENSDPNYHPNYQQVFQYFLKTHQTYINSFWETPTYLLKTLIAKNILPAMGASILAARDCQLTKDDLIAEIKKSKSDRNPQFQRRLEAYLNPQKLESANLDEKHEEDEKYTSTNIVVAMRTSNIPVMTQRLEQIATTPTPQKMLELVWEFKLGDLYHLFCFYIKHAQEFLPAQKQSLIAIYYWGLYAIAKKQLSQSLPEVSKILNPKEKLPPLDPVQHFLDSAIRMTPTAIKAVDKLYKDLVKNNKEYLTELNEEIQTLPKENASHPMLVEKRKTVFSAKEILDRVDAANPTFAEKLHAIRKHTKLMQTYSQDKKYEDMHRDPRWSRWLGNGLSWIIFPIALYRMYTCKEDYGTVKFWRPQHRKQLTLLRQAGEQTLASVSPSQEIICAF